MMPVEVGEHIVMPVSNTGPLFSNMLNRGLVEKRDKKKNRYQITQKGKEFLITPPEATAKKEPAPKPPSEPPSKPPAGSEQKDSKKAKGLAIPSKLTPPGPSRSD